MSITPAFFTSFLVATASSSVRVQLTGSSLFVSEFAIKAHASNSSLIYVGGSTVSSANGFRLSAGESISMGSISQRNGTFGVYLSDIFIDTGADLNGVSVAYLRR